MTQSATHNIQLRPYQRDAAKACIESLAEHKSTLLVMPTGTGKCFAPGTPILMADATIRNVEDVQPGDWLIGPDSLPRTVVSTACGREMMYRVTPTKGDPYTVNESHILSLRKTTQRANGRYPSERGGEIANLSVAEYLRRSKTWKHIHKGWRSPASFLPTTRPYLDPYILGLWLADGTSRSPEFTIGDEEPLAAVREYAVTHHLKLSATANSPGSIKVRLAMPHRPGRGGGSGLSSQLRWSDLINNKHIPLEYKRGTVAERLELLAGFLDGDGSLSSGVFDVVLKSKVLMHDIVFVSRSLGFSAYPKPCRKSCTNTGAVGDYWRICISGDIHRIPCRILRKQAALRQQKKDVLNVGVRVEPIGVGDYFGFELQGPDHLFLLGDFTVVHNTIVLCDIIRSLRDRGRAMVVAHRDELIQQASKKIYQVTGILPDTEKADQWADQDWTSWNAHAIVSSVQTQNSGRNGNLRMKRFDPSEFGLLVIDEAHHCSSMTYRRMVEHYQQNPELYVLGVTATPDRHDEAALGQVFKTCAYEYYIVDAVRDGWLVDIQQRYIEVTDLDLSSVRTMAGDLNGKDLERQLVFEEVLLGMADPVFNLSAGRKTLVFAASVAQAKRLAEILNRYEPTCARFVCGKTPKDERKQLFADYRDGTFRFLVNVGITTEGWDEPGVEVVAMCRPTKSRALYEQMLGRGTRPLPGVVDNIEPDESQRHLPYDGVENQTAIRKRLIANSAKPFMEVLDFVGNAGRHKLIGACDVLGGRYNDEVVEAAKKSLQCGAEPEDVSKALSAAQARLEAEAAKRAKIIAKSRYTLRTINPFELVGIVPDRVSGWSKQQPATDKQVALLERFRIPIPPGLCKREATQLVGEIMQRQKAKLCTPRQARVLERAGFNPQMKMALAKPIIDVLASNHWRWPDGAAKPSRDGEWPDD